MAMPTTMTAMQIHAIGPVSADTAPLTRTMVEVPEPGRGQILIRGTVCGVCHTEIDEIEGRAPPRSLPMTPGHQLVGKVIEEGPDCRLGLLGSRVGVAWIHSSCGQCEWCGRGLENLCPEFRATGRDVPGGYAEFTQVAETFAHPIPDAITDLQAAPLLCAGAVGWRALGLCELSDGEPLGLTGFGASGHLVLQMARHRFPTSALLVWARNPEERDFAVQLGANWVGDIEDEPPVAPAAIIDTTPAWRPVIAALACLAPGGKLVINAIRKESGDRNWLSSLDYEQHLWREKELKTVANVTRKDVRECLEFAARTDISPACQEYSLTDANQALIDLKSGAIRGAKALRIYDDGV